MAAAVAAPGVAGGRVAVEELIRSTVYQGKGSQGMSFSDRHASSHFTFTHDLPMCTRWLSVSP